jgi:hypothetical protein
MIKRKISLENRSKFARAKAKKRKVDIFSLDIRLEFAQSEREKSVKKSEEIYAERKRHFSEILSESENFASLRVAFRFKRKSLANLHPCL